MIMVPRRYRYVVQDRDRHGNLRTYLRRPGRPKLRLHETPGTDVFDAEYRRAIEAAPPMPARSGIGPVMPGTVHAGCIGYYGSTEFKQMAPRSQRVRRLILDHFCGEHGSKLLNTMAQAFRPYPGQDGRATGGRQRAAEGLARSFQICGLDRDGGH